MMVSSKTSEEAVSDTPKKTFGKYDRGHVEEAKAVAGEWFPV